MDFTAENLEKAVNLFYRAEAGQQAEAHQWLTEAQHSPQAWHFVWELLQPQKNSEVQFFAATTLHIKLLKYWNEVPKEHYDFLKRRIVEGIISYAMGPKIILNRLCIALSAYIIHTVTNHWPDAFEELVSSFQPQHLPNVEPERVVWILLEILTVIPEEFQSTALGTSQRGRVRSVLHGVSKDILRVAEMCLVPVSDGFNSANLTTYLNSSRCASAWIQLGGVTIETCSNLMTILVDLSCFIYWNRSDPENMSSEEIEIIEVALESLSTIMVQPLSFKYKKLVTKHTADVLEKFSKILQTEHSSLENNKDVLTNIYGMIVTIADTHSKLFVENLQSNYNDQKISIDLLNTILQCTNFPGSYPIDETSSTLTFGFWYTLQDDVLTLEPPKSAEILCVIKPYYRELVSVLLRKSSHPSTEDSPKWSADDREVFRCYRQDIADTFMYSYNVLNVEMFDIIFTKLEEALQQCCLPTINADKWNLIETCLHAFTSIAESIEWENLYLPKLMETLKTIPYKQLSPKVMMSAHEVIGAYSEWLSDHPELLQNVIPLVLVEIGEPELSPSATMALKDLTHYCQKFIGPYANYILLMCQSALQGGNLKLSEKMRLMYSLGKVLSVMPIDEVMGYLNVILPPMLEEVEAVVNLEPNVGTKTAIMTKLKLLSSLFCTLNVKEGKIGQQQPILIIVQNMMPLFVIIADKYCESQDVVEVLCLLLKHTVTTLMDDCKSLIHNILQIIFNIFTRAPQPSVLVIAKTLLIMFGKEEEYKETMKQFTYQIVSKILQMSAILEATNALSDKSDVLEAFFSLMAQLLKKNPALILAEGMDTGALFQCATLCLALPEDQTLKAATSFLMNYISQSRENAQVNVVHEFGESLVLRILLNIGGSIPRSSVDVLTDIVLVLNKKYCDNLARWLHVLLSQEGFPSVKVNNDQKEHFIKSVLREKANKRKLGDTIMEFTLLCRGIVRTQNIS